MNIIDVSIILGLVASLIRGREVGFVRQFFSTAGFFVGLFLGAWLQPHTVNLAHGDTAKVLVTVLTTLGMALLVMTLGEFVGAYAKRRIEPNGLNKPDIWLGSLTAGVSLLLLVWLGAAMIDSFPPSNLKHAVNESRIVQNLDGWLPPAPGVIAGLSHLIDPNGFPQVFTGKEPAPGIRSVTPSLKGFDDAIAATKASVVKIEGKGCGGIVDGSGFVVDNGLVATNAHVIAGINRPFIRDEKGLHQAQVIWFDPDLDFAVLRAGGLAGTPLSFNADTQADNTKAAVLGYPGGGDFDVESAVVLEHFLATGRNIYGQGETVRDIYELDAKVIPGNSGGPLVLPDGKVIGVIFAQSTRYENIGYALTAGKVQSEIAAAKERNQVVADTSCTDD
jgi:S1-C subfamily serine protease